MIALADTQSFHWHLGLVSVFSSSEVPTTVRSSNANSLEVLTPMKSRKQDSK